VYVTLLVALVVTAALALLTGRGTLDDTALRDTFLTLRASRFVAAFIAGASLAVGGVLVQGLFRNPLASPSVIGTTAGASLGGRLALLFLGLAQTKGLFSLVSAELLMPLGAVLGGLGSLMILLFVTRVRDDLVVLLLTGFLLSSLFLALGGFVTSLAQERWELARAMVSFALGDVAGVGARQIALSLPLLVAGGAAAMFWAGPLDVLLSGEEEAQALGVDVRQVRRWCVVWTAVLTAAAVSIGGTVGFVGLIVPHALRPFLGARHRVLVPAALLLGGVFLGACDVLARSIPARTEIPLGVVTSLIGAPFFLWLLIRSRRELTGA
jgi:iron complex transport system permease protein